MENNNRKQEQESRTKLQAERKKNDKAFTLSAVGQAEIEPDSGKLLRVNEKLSSITGYTESELLTMTAHDLVHPDDRVLFPGKAGDTENGRHPYLRCIRKDRDIRWIEAHETVFSGDGEQRPIGLLMIVDRTEEKLREDEVKEANRRVESVSRVKNEFLAHVSHELRTPLGGIMGMVELLMHRTPDTEEQEFLSKIRESTESLLIIVKDILDLSSIDTGKLELRIMEFDLHKELERTANLFAESARKKGLKFALRASLDIPRRVYGDPARLSQILRNLINNALKYTQQGQVTVTAESQGEVEGEEIMLFTVSDTGPGIPEEKSHLLFTEFGRLRDVYTKQPEEGTGLGLAIAKKLVQLMKGNIWYSSEEGKGTTFYFTVRLKRSHARQSPDKEEQPISNTLAALPPLRVLLAEDNIINRMFLGMMLKDAGHSTIEVENGADAVAKVKESFENGDPLDLILMDIQMPELNGMEATRQIRKLPGPAAMIPVIAITAFAMEEDEERFLHAGMQGYVTKPIDFDELVDTIMQVTEADYLE